jgi:hypothetical protein
MSLLQGAMVERGNGDYPEHVAPAEFHRSLKYSLIFRPPEEHSNSNIDLSRLTVEWLCVIALTGSLITVLGKRKELKESNKTHIANGIRQV